MKAFIKKLYCEYRRLRQGVWGNYWNFKHGFKATTVKFCGINKSNYTEFVSDEEFRKRHPLNKAYSGIIDNKVYLPYLFKEYKEYLPAIFYFKDDCGFLNLCTGKRAEMDDFLYTLRNNNILVLKHTYSEVGRGFILCEYRDGEYYINRKKCNENNIINTVTPLTDYVVEEYVYQHKFLNEINSSSLNTLRFLLVWSKRVNSFVLARCFQRFGCNDSLIDNLGGGNGVLIYVDVNSGKYDSCGVVNVAGSGETFSDNIKHPNSDFEFGGKDVPNFFEIKEKCIEIMNSVSFLKFVALDIAITDSGFKIIETNSYPAPDIAQLHYGFKADPNFDYFF